MSDVPVAVVFKANTDDLKKGVGEAGSSIADLKQNVIDKTSQMTGVSRGLIEQVARLSPAYIAVGAAVAVMAKAYADGAAEVKQMNLAIALGGDISGQTASSLRALSADMATHSQLTIAQAKDIAGALASSGQIGAGAFRQISLVAGDFARVMGTDVKAVGPALVKLFDDPAKGAEELNKRMHFLSMAELEHIAHLERMGEVTAAQTELAEKLGTRMSEIAPKLGLVEQAWDALKGAASKAWDVMMGIGREASPHDKLKGRLDGVLAMIKDAENSPTMRGMLPGLMQKAARLQDEMEAESQKALDKSQAGEQNAKEQRARAGLGSLKSVQAEKIDDEIKLYESLIGKLDHAAEKVAELKEKRAKLFAAKEPKAERETSGISDALARRQMGWEQEAFGVAGQAARKWKEQGDAAQRAMEIMPEAQRKLAAEIAKIDHDAAQETERLNRMQREGHIDAGVHAAAIGKLSTETANYKARVTELLADQERLNSSWEHGADQALQKYLDQVNNVAGAAGNLLVRGFNLAEDAAVKFFRTGRIDARAMFDEMVNGLLKMQVQASFTKPLGAAIQDSGGFGNLFSSAGSFLKNLLPSFDVGTDYVPYDMVAQIHKGERITPASQNNGAGGGITIMQPITINAPGADAGTIARIRDLMPGFIAENARVVVGAVRAVMVTNGGKLTV